MVAFLLMKCLHRWLPATLLMLSPAQAGEDVAFFESRVQPLLQEHCYECHSHEKKIKGGLALDLKAGWQQGGDHGPAIVPGDLMRSHLIQAVRYGDPEREMPPKGKLPPEDIAVLEKWVAMGAPDPREGTPEAAPQKVIDVEAGRKFWAFQPVGDPEPPMVKDQSWPLDPLDHFLLEKLETGGIPPAPDAEAATWLRRVSLDLTGLPPSVEDLEAFTSAKDGPHEAAVDRLLASPAFGERWARHWLDLVGYADQIGTSNSVFAEHAWRYRDYVIEAFNADKPFNRFIREQIAGDLLPATTPEERAANITATGFLVLGDVEIVAVDKLRMEHDLVDQQVSKVGTAFLGMTLGCARCHDHKFDPIGLEDYYGIAGMFRSTSSTYKTDNGVWSSVNQTVLPETPRQRTERTALLAQHEARLKSLQEERERARNEKKEVKPLDAAIEHAKFFAPIEPRTFAVHDVVDPSDMRLTIRGNPYALGDTVTRGVLRVASWSPLPPIPTGESGRRQLADWIADPRNPLTARVTVNRIWQKLFGEGLVRSVDYFGTRGEPPTHPGLLDHLATRFMKEGWSSKQLIRALVLSRAYRMSSTPGVLAQEKDPGNRLLSRMNRQRLDAEAIRDSTLAVSGTLALSGGGPALPLEYPENVTSLSPKAVNPPAFKFSKMRPVQDHERTVYLPVIRTATQPGSAKLRDVFDFTQPAQIAGKRAETAVPTQALFLLNSDLIRARANDLAQVIIREGPDTATRLKILWRRVLSRPITSDERAEALTFLDSLPADVAWTELSHALLSSNEFLIRL